MPEDAIALEVEEADLTLVLRVGLGPLAAEAEEAGVRLRLVTVGEIPTVFVDHEKLAWCVKALVCNALCHVTKDSASGGAIVVRVARDERHRDAVQISVEDNGPGIPDAKLPFLFERRGDAPHADGLVVGLELVRDVVAVHGGRIEVESRRGGDDHGTRITLRVPLSLDGASRP